MRDPDKLHTPFHSLTQDTVIDAIESLGHICDLRVFPLNSYENRVYQVGIEDKAPLIAKFYRPNRWTKEQIREEHDFMHALAELEIPVVPPIKNKHGDSLYAFNAHAFSLSTRFGGHAPNLDDLETLYRIGQHLGRIHALGATGSFKHRPSITLETYAIESRNFLLENDFLPSSLKPAYEAISAEIIAHISPIFEQTNFKAIRLHGDCHPGNILQRDDSLYFVDFDDARMGPAIQDIWMLLSGERAQRQIQLGEILEGYEEFFEFDNKEIALVEIMRAFRLLHYSAWLAKRWKDPAFPHAFPWFNTEKYWAEHILELKEQFSLLHEPILERV